MTYYELESKYEGDVTKHCGLTINEVDGNFYELETKLNTLIDEITVKFDKIEDRIRDIEDKISCVSETMHDADICPPGTSNDATYTLASHYQMNIGGEIDYDSVHGGNRFGVAIKPDTNNRSLYPNAKWYIFDDEMEGTLWDEIDTNPQGWATALYLYPKVERTPLSDEITVSLAGKSECSNVLRIKIDWDDNKSETYYYIVDENVILKGE